MCPGFARNEKDYKFRPASFSPFGYTDYKYLWSVLLSEDEGILKPFSLSDSNQLGFVNARGWRLLDWNDIQIRLHQGLTHQEYTVCGTIASDAKIHVGNQEIAVRPDDILVNALYFKLLQRYANESTKEASILCKVPRRVEHFANVSAVVTASNLSTLPKDELYLDRPPTQYEYFIEQNQKNCTVFNKLDPSFVPSALSFFVNAPYQTGSDMKDARVSSLFAGVLSKPLRKKFKQWASFTSDSDNVYVDFGMPVSRTPSRIRMVEV